MEKKKKKKPKKQNPPPPTTKMRLVLLCTNLQTQINSILELGVGLSTRN